MLEEIREHIIKLLNAGVRIDSRKPLEFRKPIKIETGIVNTAEGSARVTIGKTDVIAGIKVEIGEPYPDLPDEGTIIVGAELLPLSNPEFESGPPGIQAIELARVIDRGIRESKAIDFKKLIIEEGKKVWLLLIDICTINDDGNLFDASSLAVYAALKDTCFPKVENDKINYKEKTNKKLPLVDVPVEVTVSKIDKHFIVDTLIEEEKIVDARLTVASTKDGKLCALQKGGDTPLNIDDIKTMVDIALEKAKELRGLL